MYPILHIRAGHRKTMRIRRHGDEYTNIIVERQTAILSILPNRIPQHVSEVIVKDTCVRINISHIQCACSVANDCGPRSLASLVRAALYFRSLHAYIRPKTIPDPDQLPIMQVPICMVRHQKPAIMETKPLHWKAHSGVALISPVGEMPVSVLMRPSD